MVESILRQCVYFNISCFPAGLAKQPSLNCSEIMWAAAFHGMWILSWLLFRWENVWRKNEGMRWWADTVWGRLMMVGDFKGGGLACRLDHMLSPACSCHANEPHNFNTFRQCVSWALPLVVCCICVWRCDCVVLCVYVCMCVWRYNMQ